MAYRNLVLSLAALLLAFSLGANVHADDFERLKGEVTSAEKTYNDAVKAENAADRAVKDNKSKQAKASDAELRKLKSECIDLQTRLRAATFSRMNAAETLAKKRAELRDEASKVAEQQIDSKSDVNTRANKAGEAVASWRDALGAIPEVPGKSNDVEGLDPEQIDAVRKAEKSRVESYIEWCKAELEKLEEEIKRAGKLVDNEAKFKGADAQERMIKETKELKKKLSDRKTTVSANQKAAKDVLKSLDK